MLGRNESDARHDKGEGTSEETEAFEVSAGVIEIIFTFLKQMFTQPVCRARYYLKLDLRDIFGSYF